MNKEVKKLICEIVGLCFIIIINVVIWSNLKEDHLKKTEAVMNYVNNISMEIINKEDYYLFPMTDEYAKNNLTNNTIKVTNYSTNYKEYILYLKVDKSSTLDIENLKFMFNDSVINFNNVYSYQDERYIYYQVYNNNIKDTDYIDYIFWLKSDCKITNVNFIYSFELI